MYVLEAHGAFADAELEAEGVLLEAAALAHAGGEGVPGLAGGDAKGVVDQDFFNAFEDDFDESDVKKRPASNDK